ncbi:MAG: SAM-dependent methyltransferase, partial [Elusimicrobia bacterium]|nr:SAM-dependent methyltransferase [Elusimicrobiota bacterium]
PELEAPAAAMTGFLEEGARHAVGLEAKAWIAAAASRVEEGFILSIDYGKRFAAGTANPPRAFHRHAVETELTREPGARDLTASVDFEALIAAGYRANLGLESYESLSKFMIEGGMLDWISAAAGDDSAAYRERAKLKTLIHPEGMGEVFKVLIQRKAK